MVTDLVLNLDRLLPELIVAGTALGVILTELLLPAGRRALPAAATACIGLAVALLHLLIVRPEGMVMHLVAPEGSALAGTTLTGWSSDAFSVFVRALAAGGGLLTVLLAVPYTRRFDRGHGEFHALLLFAVLGVMLVSGVQDLLSLFVCLELVTITSYVLAAFKRNDVRSTEAGLKYLVIGAVSSAVLLFGIALTYGAVGEVAFEAIAARLAAGSPSLLLMAGLVLLVVGVLFKVGGVPFHVWIPDVYQGAPTPVTAFLSTGSKAAGVVLLLRLGSAIFLPVAGTATATLWVWLLGVVSVATLLMGILGALSQRTIKRLFGYSSIGHAGYLLMGVAALAAADAGGSGPATTAILYYLLAFVFTNLTAFAVIVLVSRSGQGGHEAAAWSGLARRSPFLALAMALALLSLAGIPPLSGFFGKFLVLAALVRGELFPLALIGAAGVAVSLYFYLLWIKQMYMLEPEPGRAATPIAVGPWAGAVIVVGIVAMLAMGIFMGPFYGWVEHAAAAL